MHTYPGNTFKLSANDFGKSPGKTCYNSYVISKNKWHCQGIIVSVFKSINRYFKAMSTAVNIPVKAPPIVI